MNVDPSGIMEAVRLFLQWAKENNIGPLQTVTMAVAIGGLFALSKFVKSAKTVVGGVHHVYEQALEDQKEAAADLRSALAEEKKYRQELQAELEQERRLREDALRVIAQLRASLAEKGHPL